MPDIIIKQVEYWANKDKQRAWNSLSFQNRNNECFDWDDDVDNKPLVVDNAPEPIAPFPDIPTELPGIDTETDLLPDEPLPTVIHDDPPHDLIDKWHICHAAKNADVDPNIIFSSAKDDRSG